VRIKTCSRLGPSKMSDYASYLPLLPAHGHGLSPVVVRALPWRLALRAREPRALGRPGIAPSMSVLPGCGGSGIDQPWAAGVRQRAPHRLRVHACGYVDEEVLAWPPPKPRSRPTAIT